MCWDYGWCDETQESDCHCKEHHSSNCHEEKHDPCRCKEHHHDDGCKEKHDPCPCKEHHHDDCCEEKHHDCHRKERRHQMVEAPDHRTREQRFRCRRFCTRCHRTMDQCRCSL